MKKIILLTILTTIFFTAGIPTASAQTNCDGIYGGGTTCGTTGFILKKQVADPTNTSHFVDNLGPNDAHYHFGSMIYFKFTIKNNTNNDLTGVTVTDTLPKFVTYQGNPQNYNTAANTVTLTIGTLHKGQTQTQSISGIIANAQKSPITQQVTCVVNQAQANASNGQGTQASSEFCIDKSQIQNQQVQSMQTTKGGLPVNNGTQVQNHNSSFPVYTPKTTPKQTPKSGPEALPLLAMFPTGALGMWLRKKAK